MVNTDPLIKHAKQEMDRASKELEAKVEFFTRLVEERISAQLPMGDFPKNASQFLKWTPDGFSEINRGTFYQAHNDRYKHAVEKLCRQVKTPPILNSEADRYEHEIKNLKKQISGLASVNLKLRGKVKKITDQMQFVVADKDKEIKRLKGLIPKINNLRHL